ncbi:hypothetical protein SAMN05192559_104267 [Halobacillus karajensis]|uniref:Uncharacterized protein n=1 Tax=Halobacillus karajensis TaxID=195088 RepID=A0A024P1R1_9BACI|nr:hypothetical protein [Halobacillus karajensis]CDQ19506.1 hypothetical protein BN982_01801 [Halobacillus karajensis]CDQ21968.1 hypothetical protein BN983_00164 [Halobacillus karajensis]CDQ27809.1 hypothetical protein BN981_02091 [Halobacillus karajensis]SEH81238.1 hypothetical protein SAMN05192559_104267 [Halobacillus karajensis]
MGAYWFQGYVESDTGPYFSECTVNKDKFVRDRIGKESYKYMVLDGFSISPGHVMLDRIHPIASSPSVKDTGNDYIKRGCTLLLTQHLVTSLRHYRAHYEYFLTLCKELPLDYMIVPVVPAKLLRPEMVRFFARKGSPFLCIEVGSRKEFDEVCWEWLAQAQSFKRMPLTLFVKDTENTSNNYSEMWSSLCEQYGIIKLTDVQDDEILSLQNLKDSGIYPIKGSIVPGGQADYNLYRMSKGPTFEEQEDFRYHNAVPNVTVMNGQVKQVDQKISDQKPGSHIKVKIHKHFV